MIKKFFKILLCNILVFVSLIFITDVIIYLYYSGTYHKSHYQIFELPKFSYVIKPYYGIDIETYFNGSNNVFRGRKPDGLEFSKNPPIVVFGCSFAHGQFLNYNQTFSYKLSQILKRPVYNRAVPGRGIGCMYWQSINKHFYKSVPPCNDVIYIILDDHYRRLLINYIDILDLYMIGHFTQKGNNLYLDGNNYLKNLITSSYTYKILNGKYVTWYINNPKHENELTDTVLLYFIKTRENLQKHWKIPVNFTIIYYYNNLPLQYKQTLFKKFEDNNFKVIETNKLTDINLSSEEYKNSQNLHPTEKAWDVLTPLIAKELLRKDN